MPCNSFGAACEGVVFRTDIALVTLLLQGSRFQPKPCGPDFLNKRWDWYQIALWRRNFRVELFHPLRLPVLFWE